MKCPNCGYEPEPYTPKTKSVRNLDIVIRHESGESLSQIAKRFGISRSRVRQIVLEHTRRRKRLGSGV
jgi:DNA-directed RNA polymerase sigma subunit (sigma70/sigma32)